MCTISLTYDQNNALAQRKLDELLKSGLFKRTETVADRELRELERRACSNGPRPSPTASCANWSVA